jgi:hypothetical protein
LVSDIKGGAQTEGVLENRVLRKMFRQKRGEVIESWRKGHNEKLRNL